MTERHALERARDAGVNLVFAGANAGYWQIRYEDGRRTIVAYTGQTDWNGNRGGPTGTARTSSREGSRRTRGCSSSRSTCSTT